MTEAINLSDLSPAPWKAKDGEYNVVGSDDKAVATCWSSTFAKISEESKANRDFIVLARAAFEVMVRRGWHPFQSRHTRKWSVDPGAKDFDTILAYERAGLKWYHDDPFTALVEADKWLTAQEQQA